jgi:hypothetical protein
VTLGQGSKGAVNINVWGIFFFISNINLFLVDGPLKSTTPMDRQGWFLGDKFFAVLSLSYNVGEKDESRKNEEENCSKGIQQSVVAECSVDF